MGPPDGAMSNLAHDEGPLCFSWEILLSKGPCPPSHMASFQCSSLLPSIFGGWSYVCKNKTKSSLGRVWWLTLAI